MYTYEFERIDTITSGFGMFSGSKYSAYNEYQEIIQKRAQNGWRFVGYIPTVQRNAGYVEQLTLFLKS